MDVSFGEVVLSTLWFMLVFAWIWLMVSILTDIFRDHSLSGWAKAAWTVFLIVLPWLGFTLVGAHLVLLAWETRYVSLQLASPGLRPRGTIPTGESE